MEVCNTYVVLGTLSGSVSKGLNKSCEKRCIYYKQTLICSIKGIVTNFRIIPKSFEFSSSSKHKGRYF